MAGTLNPQMMDGSGINIDSRLLLLAPTGKDASLAEGILQRAGIAAVSCRNLEDVCEKLRNGAGALLIAEEAIPLDNERSLASFLCGQPSWSDLPILVLARTRADSAAVARAMDRLGNVTVLERPIRIASLVSSVRSALRARSRQYQLRDEQEQLKRAHHDLEERVRDRTARLAALNEVLQGQIAEREAAEARAHELLRQVVTAQEKERSRIARDIHDELGQQMTSLRLHLTEVLRNLDDAEKVRADLNFLEKQANRIDDHISFLAWEIRPSNLETFGLVDALNKYVNEWSRNFNVAADFVASPSAPPALLPEIEINLYRITQEALNNVAKYSKATEVAVLLSVSDRDVTVIIEDNGVGFDRSSKPATNGHGGLGLQGMHERAELLGGTFEIESAPGNGTRLYTRIPAKFKTPTSARPEQENDRAASAD